MKELNRFFEEVYKDAMHFKEMKVSQLSRQIANNWKGENYQVSKDGSERDKYNQIISCISNACRTGGGTNHNFENDLNGAHNQVSTEVFVPLVVIDAAHRIADEFHKITTDLALHKHWQSMLINIISSINHLLNYIS